MKHTAHVLALLILLGGILLPASADQVNLSAPGQSAPFEQENLLLVTGNVTHNSTLLHHVYYHPSLEIPPWFWIFLIIGGVLLLVFSFLWAGAIQVNLITSVMSLLFLFTAQFTSFVIRDVSFYAGWGYFVDADNAVMALVTIQPVEVAWDWIIPFFFTLGLVVLAILNFVVIALEMGGPGMKYFRSNIFRRG